MSPLKTQKPLQEEFFPEKYVKRAVKILKLLSDENRLRVMLYLAKHERAFVSEISEALDLHQTTLSHHLSLLRTADLVVTLRDGKNVYYEINKPLWREMGLQFFTYLGKGSNVKFLDKFILRMIK
ncbi:MAG: ArsR/SmtB family transcription factor [bacterium]